LRVAVAVAEARGLIVKLVAVVARVVIDRLLRQNLQVAVLLLRVLWLLLLALLTPSLLALEVRRRQITPPMELLVLIVYFLVLHQREAVAGLLTMLLVERVDPVVVLGLKVLPAVLEQLLKDMLAAQVLLMAELLRLLAVAVVAREQ
jgi:hypothetical protein